MFDFKVTLQKNEPAFNYSTEQNATVVIQSVNSKVGMLAARFPQSDQWSGREGFFTSF